MGLTADKILKREEAGVVGGRSFWSHIYGLLYVSNCMAASYFKR